MTNMEHLTAGARRVVDAAEDEARRLGHNFVGTEHLLLALTRETDVLEPLGISPTDVRSQVENTVGYGPCPPPLGRRLPYSLRARRVLVEMAPREALAMNTHRVDVEHLVLGLLRDRDGTAGQVLAGLGADLNGTRRTLKGGGPRS